MAILDDIKKTAEKAANAAAEKGKELYNKAGEAVEVGKINVKIVDEENKIEDLKKQIGEVVYTAFVEDKCCKEDVAGYVEMIKASYEAIETYRKQIEEVKKA